MSDEFLNENINSYEGEEENKYDDYDNSEINNTDLNGEYENRYVYIRLNNNPNDRRNRLKISEEKLSKKFPAIKNMQTDNRLGTILENEFRDGFPKNIYIRNLTFQKDEKDIQVLAIRPEIAPGDYLLELFPEGISLMFRGHIWGREFIVDDIYDTADTEQLDFEVAASVIPQNNPNGVVYNFFFKILEKAESLAKYTSERLENWKEYLRWYKQICIRQVYGFKYYRFQYDSSKKQLMFWLVCENEDYFKKRKRYLNRDMQVFDNDYSKNDWKFEFESNDSKKIRNLRRIELGRYRGVKESYYLEGTGNLNASDEEQFDDYDEEDYEEPDNTHNSKKNLTEDDVCEAFKRPYIVKVAYELPRDIKDKLQDIDSSDEEELTLVEEDYLSDYSSNGFLALSAVGDLALIRRFELAIQSLERDECYSPNLAAWLFNINQARLPNRENNINIDRWLNPNIAENENQKEAVRKMIAAPDICLIQGPPGTGKTTVIAEAIYQLVRQGQRVLVASQSNDAVDNALERLADTPEIRAIRLGQKSRKKKNISLDKRKFSEDEALRYYYNSLSSSISKKWLEPWENFEKEMIAYRKDEMDAQNFQQDIAEFQQKSNKIITELHELEQKYKSIYEQIHQINQQNAQILDEKRKALQFKSIIDNDSDERIFLTEQLFRIIEPILNPVIRKAYEQGIKLTLGELNLNTQGTENESDYIRIILQRLPLLKNICKKLNECKTESVQNESSIAILINQRDEILNKIVDADADDMETLFMLKKQLAAVKEKIETAKGFGSSVSLGMSEKSVLSDRLSSCIISGNIEGISSSIEQTIQETKNALHQALSDIMEYTDNLQTKDISALNEQLKIFESQIAYKKQTMQETNSVLEQKKATLTVLSRKYQTSSEDVSVILEAIHQIRHNTEQKISESRMIRQQWNDTLTQFKDRLDDEQLFSCDQRYYQPIYVNSCNVVGISCTDNMRVLTENGYDNFDVVIVDEVSKATPPELLIPLMKARKAILVGDHRQLPPMFKEHEQSYNDLISDHETIPEELSDLMTTENFRRFRDMVTSSLFKEYFERADESIRHPLLVQYRMHSDIMRVINRFYENRLSNGLTPEQETEYKSHGLTIYGADGSEFIVPSKHAYWLDSSALPNTLPIYDSRYNPTTKNEGGTSAYNTLEQYMVVELLKKMAESWKEQYQTNKIKKTVGVISFYQAQVNRIRELFRDAKRMGFDFSPLDIDINTVDRFQGKEKNVIITSLVTNSPKGWASKHVITFERINVAFSRAQQLLLIVGAKHTYEKQKIELPNMENTGTSTVSVYQNIMQEMYTNGCFKGSEKLITSDIEKQILKEYQGGDN